MAQDPLSLLCIEPHFPGRLGAVADWLVRCRGFRCQFYFHSAGPAETWPASVGNGLDLVRFNVGGVAREPSAHWTRQLERGLCYAFGCWEVLQARQPRPVELIVGRSAGLGSTLFAPVFLPRVPIVNWLDYYFQAHANDLADGVEEDMPVEYFHWRRSANAIDLLDLENGVRPWTQTCWQRDQFPVEYRDDFKVLYAGVESPKPAPRSETASRTVAGRVIPATTRVVSFVARCLDRTRGFDRFMTLADRLMRRRTDVLCIVVGDPTVGRGLDVQFYNRDFRAHVLSRSPPHDPERIWFLGPVSPGIVREVLRASDLHVYASRPYVVSRSLVEAMAFGVPVMAAEVAPVREFLTHGRTGLLVEPGDMDAWEQQACSALDDPAALRTLGEAASATVRERYSQEATMPLLAEWFNELAGGGG